MNDVACAATDNVAEASIVQLDALCENRPFVSIDGLCAGYGKMQILFNVDLRVGRGQSLCLVGPNGAGKSTVLHAIFGFTDIHAGRIAIGEGAEPSDVTDLAPSEKLARAGIAYILQDKSIFPELTVEENLWMGGFLKRNQADARDAAERVFDEYPRLAALRRQNAGVLSGGERRMLEITRALIMDPSVLLVDEPSIGLEPRAIAMVFELLYDLQRGGSKTIIMVEQNVTQGLEFADIGYVLVGGRVALADAARDVLNDPRLPELFLGG